MLASGSNDYSVKIWNPLAGECLMTLKHWWMIFSKCCERRRAATDMFENGSWTVKSVSWSNAELLASWSGDTQVKILADAAGLLVEMVPGSVVRIF